MARRFSIWPAYADLFMGLAIVLLGFYALETRQNNQLNRAYAAVRQENEELRRRLTGPQEFAAKVLDDLVAKDQRVVDGVTYKRCSDEDVCVDVELTFGTSDDHLSPTDIVRVRHVSRSIRSVLEAPRFDSARRFVQIVVEGHTDCRVPEGLAGREAFKYNWDLSAKRASAVMHELAANGLGDRTAYNVVSWGRGASEDYCAKSLPCTREDTPCKSKSRRTTVRLKFDYKAYAAASGPGRVS